MPFSSDWKRQRNLQIRLFEVVSAGFSGGVSIAGIFNDEAGLLLNENDVARVCLSRASVEAPFVQVVGIGV